MSIESAYDGSSREARDRHEQFLQDLSDMMPGSACGLASKLRRADTAYEFWYGADIFRDKPDILSDEPGRVSPFILPSVQREILYQEEVNRDRPPLIAQSFIDASSTDRYVQEYDISYIDMLNPRTVMRGFDGPVAIREKIEDNDPIQGSLRLNWLGCSSVEEATLYCQRVGWHHEQPRTGDEDGIYTVRQIYDNPYFLEAVNAELGEVDLRTIQATIREAVAIVSLRPADLAIETAIRGIVLNVALSNNTAKQELLDSGDAYKVSGYLNPEVRLNALTCGEFAIEENINQTIAYLRAMLTGDSSVNLSSDDISTIYDLSQSLAVSLQVPHELMYPTRCLIAYTLEGLTLIAKLKTYATQEFLQSGSQKLAGESATLIDQHVKMLWETTAKRYSAIMTSYAAADHIGA